MGKSEATKWLDTLSDADLDNHSQVSLANEAWKRGAAFAAQEILNHIELIDTIAMTILRTMLRDALRSAHSCATLRDDGFCDGCPVSDALKLADERERDAQAIGYARIEADKFIKKVKPVVQRWKFSGLPIGKRSQ